MIALGSATARAPLFCSDWIYFFFSFSSSINFRAIFSGGRGQKRVRRNLYLRDSRVWQKYGSRGGRRLSGHASNYREGMEQHKVEAEWMNTLFMTSSSCFSFRSTIFSISLTIFFFSSSTFDFSSSTFFKSFCKCFKLASRFNAELGREDMQRSRWLCWRTCENIRLVKLRFWKTTGIVLRRPIPLNDQREPKK